MDEEHVWHGEELHEKSDSIDGDILFDDVSFEYPVRRDASVLQNLNLLARNGETTAIVGPSGCGKFKSSSACAQRLLAENVQARVHACHCYFVSTLRHLAVSKLMDDAFTNIQ